MVNGKTARAHWVCRKQSQMPEGIRLNKFLASCGVASRRKCDDLIAEGHVEINGKIVIELGTKVLPTDHVKFDGRRLSQESEMTIILNKPMGYVCTRHDPEGRKNDLRAAAEEIPASQLRGPTRYTEFRPVDSHQLRRAERIADAFRDITFIKNTRSISIARSILPTPRLLSMEFLSRKASPKPFQSIFFPESAATWCWLRATTARFAACFRGWVTKCVISSAFSHWLFHGYQSS